mmetsp:Transcript_54932/g.154524  ORF Transcript_54932/g.154524 Transcript_54932/m.154524 type:complete len:257 (+) Transcript_54932:1898-2668(+)
MVTVRVVASSAPGTRTPGRQSGSGSLPSAMAWHLYLRGEIPPPLFELTMKLGHRKSPVPQSLYSMHRTPLPRAPPSLSNFRWLLPATLLAVRVRGRASSTSMCTSSLSKGASVVVTSPRAAPIGTLACGGTMSASMGLLLLRPRQSPRTTSQRPAGFAAASLAPPSSSGPGLRSSSPALMDIRRQATFSMRRCRMCSSSPTAALLAIVVCCRQDSVSSSIVPALMPRVGLDDATSPRGSSGISYVLKWVMRKLCPR